MVLKYLAQFAQRFEQASRRESLKKLARNGLKVVVDGDALLYHLYFTKVDWSYGGDNERLTQAVTAFVRSLAKFNITMLVFIPGYESSSSDVEDEKGRTRTQVLADVCGNIVVTPTQRSIKGFRFHPLARTVFAAALRSNGVKFSLTDGPVFPYVVAYSIDNKVPVIGYESFYLATAVPSYIHCDSIQFTKDDCMAQVIVPGAIAAALEISVPEYQLGCRLLPSDAMETAALAPFRDFLCAKVSTPFERDLRNGQLFALFKYVKAFCGPRKYAEAVAAKNAKSVSLIEDEFLAAVLRDNAAYFAEHRDVYAQQPTADSACISVGERDSSGGAMGMGLGLGAEARSASGAKASAATGAGAGAGEGTPFPFSDDAIRAMFAATAGMYALKSYSTPLVLDNRLLALPAWVTTFFKQGKIPSWLLSAINCGFVVLTPGVEDCRDTTLGASSACLPAADLRATAYSLLGFTSMPEKLRMGTEWTTRQAAAPRAQDLFARLRMPALQDLGGGFLDRLPSLSAAVRRDLVLQFILEGDMPLFTLIRARFDYTAPVSNENGDAGAVLGRLLHDAFVTACLCYFVRRMAPLLTPEVFAALLTQTVMPVPASTVARMMSNGDINRDMTAMHAGAVWQFTVEAALAVNGLMGYAFDIALDDVFHGAALLVGVEQEQELKNSLLRRYNEVLCSATPVEQNEAIQSLAEGRASVMSRYLPHSREEQHLLSHLRQFERLRQYVDVVLRRSGRCPAYGLLLDGSYMCARRDGAEGAAGEGEDEGEAGHIYGYRQASVHASTVPAKRFAGLTSVEGAAK